MRKTLERWLGPAAQSERLAGAGADQLRPAGRARDLADVQQRVRAVAPAARIIAHRDSVGPLLQLAAAAAVGRLRAGAAAERRPPPPRWCLPRGARSTRTVHDRGHARHRRHRPAGHAFVPAQDRASMRWPEASPEPSPRRWSCSLLASGAAFAGELTGGATLGAIGPGAARLAAVRACGAGDVGCADGGAVGHCARRYDRPRSSRSWCCFTRSASCCSPSRSANRRRPGTPATDAAVVLTGGSGPDRTCASMCFVTHSARRLFVSGADPAVTKPDLARRLRQSPAARTAASTSAASPSTPAPTPKKPGAGSAAPLPFGPADHQRLAHAPRPL